MRTLLTALMTSLAVLPATPAAPAAWEPTPAGWVSGPVRHVRTVPVETGTAVGGNLHEGYLYVTTWRSFSIYDASVPEDPRLVSVTPLGFRFINEGPATNGEILLLMEDVPTRILHIYDVTDKAAPREIATFPTAPAADHIFTCVLDCAYAYGSGGSILDLSNPAAPVRVGNWRDTFGARGVHGIGEVRPGVVLTGSLPQHYLDARTDPANPTRLATVEPPTTRFATAGVVGNAESPISYVDWPRDGRGHFALSTTETPFSGACGEHSGGLVVYDTRDHEETGTFRIADVYRITRNGSPSEGLAPHNAIGCSALGLDAHPDWKQTPVVAVGWAENGVRLLRVDKHGRITEAGGFLGHGTEAFAPIWASDTVLYSIDTARGLDVLEVSVPKNA